MTDQELTDAQSARIATRWIDATGGPDAHLEDRPIPRSANGWPGRWPTRRPCASWDSAPM